MKLRKWLILPLALSLGGLMVGCGGDESTAVCQNGIVETGEQCDDGNSIDNDACSNACQLVDAAVCGNGVLESPEQCDDGNEIAADGCENNCTVTPDDCGDGLVDAGEECDDGNFIAGDACTNDCKNAVCGDAIIQVGIEACDDGNQDNSDACLNDCTVNPLLNCGDGIVDAGEECDDGNEINGDGCENSCAISLESISLQQFKLGEAINDDTYDGTIASMTCTKFNIPMGVLNTFVEGSLRLGINHGQLGNLVIKVIPPIEGDTLTVLNRPGFDEAQDDGSEPGAGDDSLLSATAPITFIDGANFNAEQMGNTLDATQTACADDGRCNYHPDAGIAGAAEFVNLVGTAVDGDWTVCVGDAEVGQAGTLESVELFITKKL